MLVADRVFLQDVTGVRRIGRSEARARAHGTARLPAAALVEGRSRGDAGLRWTSQSTAQVINEVVR